jgi:hypothetical protein
MIRDGQTQTKICQGRCWEEGNGGEGSQIVGITLELSRGAARAEADRRTPVGRPVGLSESLDTSVRRGRAIGKRTRGPPDGPVPGVVRRVRAGAEQDSD